MKPELKEIVNLTRLQLGIDDVKPDDRLMEELSATSVDIVNIIATLEERYDIEIDDSDLADSATVRELFTLAEQKWLAKA